MAAQQQQCSYCGKSMIEWHKPAYSSQIGHITKHYEKSSWMVCPSGCARKKARNKRWAVMGCFQLVIWVGLMLFLSNSYDMSLTLSNSIGVYFLSWFVAELLNANLLNIW